MKQDGAAKDKDSGAVEPEQAANDIHYEGNPKHKEPWQRGRKGSLCPKELGVPPLELLKKSVLESGKRYACHGGKAYCAQEHEPGRWHGYPIGWREVPADIALRMVKDGLVSKRDRRKYWEGHE